MRKYLVAFIWIFIAAAPAGAQQAGGMNAMGYYVGTWACVGGPLAQPPVHATVVFAMNGSVLNSSVSVPQQTGMKTPYNQTSATSYDGKGRYLQTSMDSQGYWGVSSAPTLTGNTEKWTDLTTSDSKPGHGDVVRTDNDHYTYTGYPTPTGTTPNFKVSCQRQSS